MKRRGPLYPLRGFKFAVPSQHVADLIALCGAHRALTRLLRGE